MTSSIDGPLVGSASQVSGCKRPLDLNRPTRRLQGGPTGFDHSELLSTYLLSLFGVPRLRECCRQVEADVVSKQQQEQNLGPIFW